MKRSLYTSIIFLTLIFQSCNSSEGKTTKCETRNDLRKTISLYDLDSVKVGWQDKYSITTLLDTIAISYQEFSSLMEQTLAPNKISQEKDIINLPLDEIDVIIKNSSQSNFEYLGYLKKIKCYVLAENSTAEGLDFSQLFLINKAEKCRYYITSIGDWRISDPVISKDGKYLAYYYNTEYDEMTSYIRIMSVNDNNEKEYYLKEHAFMDSENFAVRSIRWINNHEIAICADHKLNGISYYKLSF